MAMTRQNAGVTSATDLATTSRRDSFLAIGFQIGLALFVVSISWVLWFDVPESSAKLGVWLVLLTHGIALAGGTWIASSTLSRGTKGILIIAVLAVAISVPAKYYRQWIADRKILQPGRIERGRFRHDALGLSFKAPASLTALLDVVVRHSDSDTKSKTSSDRLHFGDEATLFRLASPKDPEGKRSPIRMSVIPFRFSRVDMVVAHVLSTQANFASQPGERLIRPAVHHRVGKLDVIDFELYSEPQKFGTRYVFIRSGAFLLMFELRSPNPEDRTLFDEFVKSIEISGRTTRFDA